ncbi:hypothetical protein OF83DRAFT_869986 [Amylostereum chailletii]|nr:hypothetical protein OF83DRAFT_869986 [Amylostereum chailletii]
MLSAQVCLLWACFCSVSIILLDRNVSIDNQFNAVYYDNVTFLMQTIRRTPLNKATRNQIRRMCNTTTVLGMSDMTASLPFYNLAHGKIQREYIGR